MVSEKSCDVEDDEDLSARMHHTLLLPHRPSTAPASGRNSNFNQSPKISAATFVAATTKKSTPPSSSMRWNPFSHRQRRFSGDETQEKQHLPAVQSAVIGAGEEMSSVSRLVAFRRAKSCRRKDESGEEIPEPPPDRMPSQECLDKVLEEETQETQSPLPTILSEIPTRGRHHSLKKWWFR
ncbi:unnamed protein product [Rodentolepis nana]|uniref:Uncharacterized protein n=1 Tax=Rodentolepis nana TaxID=102285 RepID=A0A0R3T9E3_RODNA|nr:unnamed protein product [Rodentolepis nana]